MDTIYPTDDRDNLVRDYERMVITREERPEHMVSPESAGPESASSSEYGLDVLF